MKTAIVYLHIVGKSDENAPPPEHYAPWSERFMRYYHKAVIPPAFKVDLVVCCCGGSFDDQVEQIYPEAASFLEYHGAGWDIGAHQHAAHLLDGRYDFVINCATPVYFKDPNFVLYMLRARQRFGDGFYGPTASYQVSPHIRTCCWAADIATFKQYPYAVCSRENTFDAESNPRHSITRWYEDQGKAVMMVARDGEYSRDSWRTPANIFRRGDQSNCLVGDRHTDIYEAASPEEKVLLEALADGRTPE